jgi:hypothetical protein
MWHGSYVPNLLDALFGLLIGLLFVRLVAAFGGRLLGVRQSWWRTLLVGSLGISMGGRLRGGHGSAATQECGRTASRLRLDPHGDHAVLGRTRAARLARLVRPSAAPRRRHPAPGTSGGPPLGPMRALRPDHGNRRPVCAVSIPHRLAWNRMDRSARRCPEHVAVWKGMRSALQEAGGAFVKLGQVLSTRPHLPLTGRVFAPVSRHCSSGTALLLLARRARTPTIWFW